MKLVVVTGHDGSPILAIRRARVDAVIRGMGSVLVLWPDSRGRLDRIHPYKSPQDAICRDGQQIARDMKNVLARLASAAYG